MGQNLENQAVKKLERIAGTAGGLYIKDEKDNILWKGFDGKVILTVLTEGESVIAIVQPGNFVLLKGTKEKLLDLINPLGQHCIPLQILGAE